MNRNDHMKLADTFRREHKDNAPALVAEYLKNVLNGPITHESAQTVADIAQVLLRLMTTA